MNDNNQSPEQNNQILENHPDSSIGAANGIADNSSTKKSRIIRSLIIVFLIAMVGLGLWLTNKPAPQQIQGMVEANTLNVSTKVPSRVEQLMAEEGASVKKGQILGILTSPELQAKQQQAEGALQSARALEQTAERGSQQENIASLKANWQSALAQAELARVTYQRAQNLFNEGVISRQRRDEAQAAKNSSAQIAEAAHQQYLRAERGSTPEQLSSAQAQVKIAEAAVAEAKSLNQEMQLIAPEDSEVSQKFANVGELVPAGIPLYTLIDLRNQWVSINLREDQFNQLKHGSILHGDIPALNQKNVAFQVTHIAAQGTFASWKATRQSSGYDIRTFEIKLKSLQPLAGLRPGMSVLFDWPQSQTASTH
ncbi:HlyD family secretion protein [Alkanindiges illinoisensis]|uniref:HlyD family secretion protein n=1 Tax=Alkanindiges illinoisensis TaxID=197183 RepID=UPI00047BC53A|nr:HlyD family secretion protein [Alkanindiges illinoisensis]